MDFNEYFAFKIHLFYINLNVVYVENLFLLLVEKCIYVRKFMYIALET
jgi:hypothetical protein